MSTTEQGKTAENRVAKLLKKQKYKILYQNWRNRWCEIDIVAEKNMTVYFVEVKFRRKSVWGDGLDAITMNKLDRMSRAAEAWVSENEWAGGYELLAASVDDSSIDIVEI